MDVKYINQVSNRFNIPLSFLVYYFEFRFVRHMTLLFADICGFTAYSRTRPPEEVVQLVTNLFANIDNLSRQVGVYKVCTIGDCYVATSEPERGNKLNSNITVDGCNKMLHFASALIRMILLVSTQILILKFLYEQNDGTMNMIRP